MYNLSCIKFWINITKLRYQNFQFYEATKLNINLNSNAMKQRGGGRERAKQPIYMFFAGRLHPCHQGSNIRRQEEYGLFRKTQSLLLHMIDLSNLSLILTCLGSSIVPKPILKLAQVYSNYIVSSRLTQSNSLSYNSQLLNLVLLNFFTIKAVAYIICYSQLDFYDQENNVQLIVQLLIKPICVFNNFLKIQLH